MTTSESTRPELLEKLRESVQAGLPSAIAELSQLVRIPSVSWAAFDEQHVVDSAEAVEKLVRELGVFDQVEVSRATIAESGTLGKPAVLATRRAGNGKPTILLYAHHDVQPQGSDEDWDSPPFEPTLRGDRLYGRGAADDKAGVMAHIAAIRSLVDVVGDDFDLGLALFIRSEEHTSELQSRPHLVKHQEQLRSDVIVVADSDN